MSAPTCPDCDMAFETPSDADSFGYCVDEESCAWRCTYNQGQRETVARVVAWLRREAAKHNGPMPGVDPVGSVLVIADAIERGEWREDGDEQS